MPFIEGLYRIGKCKSKNIYDTIKILPKMLYIKKEKIDKKNNMKICPSNGCQLTESLYRNLSFRLSDSFFCLFLYHGIYVRW